MKSLIYDIGPAGALYEVLTEDNELGYFFRDDINGTIQIDWQTYYEMLEGYFLNDAFLESFFNIKKMWLN